MNTQSDKIQTLTFFIGFSVLVHMLVLFSIGRFGSYNFSTPVDQLQAVRVDLTKHPNDDITPVADSDEQADSNTDNIVEDVTGEGEHAPLQGEKLGTPPPVMEKRQVEPEPVKPSVVDAEKADVSTRNSVVAENPLPAASRPAELVPAITPPLRTAGEFLTTKTEKLTYLISLLGVPVGNAELEAKNENGEVKITLRTRSNAALSGIYPVDDLIETRHIAGNFIITKVRQQEGAFRSDIGFTIFLRDKNVFWIDRLRNRYSKETIPNSEVLDTLSSFYYLRNRPLKAGNTELLHIYDGDAYAAVPVEIVRQEEVRLRNLKKVDTLLLRHVQQRGGIFRSTGDMLIWLTNDENKVPVKLETTFPLGKVTMELVSAETQKQ